MRLLHLYTRVHGRISRKTWSLGAVALVVVYLIVRQALQLIVQYEPVDGLAEASSVSLVWATEGSLWMHRVASLVLSVIFSLLAYCLSVKRRHDRNAGGWEVAVLLGLPPLLGLFGLMQTLFPSAAPPTGPNEDGLWLFLLTGYTYQPFAIYVLVLLGLLKGTVGPNDYGPDSLTTVLPANTQEAT